MNIDFFKWFNINFDTDLFFRIDTINGLHLCKQVGSDPLEWIRKGIKVIENDKESYIMAKGLLNANV